MASHERRWWGRLAEPAVEVLLMLVSLSETGVGAWTRAYLSLGRGVVVVMPGVGVGERRTWL